MKALTKLLADFITWRWAPTIGLLSAALLYVLVVVGMIPTEIGVPVANAKFAPRPLPTGALGESASQLSTVDTSETEGAPSQQNTGQQVARGPAEFGRRGFSPPLERPDPPPPPPPPPPPVIPPPAPVEAPAAPPSEVASATPPSAPTAPTFGGPLGSRMGGMFQGISSAMRARGLTPPPSPPDSEGPEGQPPTRETEPPAEQQQQPPVAPGQAAPGGAEPTPPAAGSSEPGPSAPPQ
jgi:hypothetical protein